MIIESCKIDSEIRSEGDMLGVETKKLNMYEVPKI